jgi:hypothetical protein
MNKEIFEKLNGEQKAEFLNTELDSTRTLTQIANDHFGKSESGVFKVMGQHGYKKKRNGKFYNFPKQSPKEEQSENNRLKEILNHAETLITFAQRLELNKEVPLDLSVLTQYEGKDIRFTVSLKDSLHKELQSLATKTGTTQSTLIAIAVHYLIQSNK